MKQLAPGFPALAVALFVAACATPSSPTATTPSGHVGEKVSVRGVLKGMGKMGYILVVDGEEIYLDLDEDLSRHYGETATVRGTLRHVGPANAADLPDSCTPEAPCAVPPEHDMLTDATIDFDG